MITILLMLYSVQLNAQQEDGYFDLGNMVSDSTMLMPDDLYLTAKLPPVSHSQAVIEIRLITYPSLIDSLHCIAICYDTSWHAKRFITSRGKVIETRLEADSAEQKYLDSLLPKLVSHNVFSLPDQSRINEARHLFNPVTGEWYGRGINVFDGICYDLEFKVGNRYRRYRYCNPEDYREVYPYLHEYQDFVIMMSLLGEIGRF